MEAAVRATAVAARVVVAMEVVAEAMAMAAEEKAAEAAECFGMAGCRCRLVVAAVLPRTKAITRCRVSIAAHRRRGRPIDAMRLVRPPRLAAVEATAEAAAAAEVLSPASDFALQVRRIVTA